MNGNAWLILKCGHRIRGDVDPCDDFLLVPAVLPCGRCGAVAPVGDVYLDPPASVPTVADVAPVSRYLIEVACGWCATPLVHQTSGHDRDPRRRIAAAKCPRCKHVWGVEVLLRD